MKAALVLDQQAGIVTIAELPEAYQDKVVIRTTKAGKIEWWYPKGTVFEGEHAVFLCKTGQARPIDKECADACGMTEAQLKRAQLEYEMDFKMIVDPAARQLYAAGVIDGFDPKTGDYSKGKNWDKYEAAKQQAEGDDE